MLCLNPISALIEPMRIINSQNGQMLILWNGSIECLLRICFFCILAQYNYSVDLQNGTMCCFLDLFSFIWFSKSNEWIFNDAQNFERFHSCWTLKYTELYCTHRVCRWHTQILACKNYIVCCTCFSLNSLRCIRHFYAFSIMFSFDFNLLHAFCCDYEC